MSPLDKFRAARDKADRLVDELRRDLQEATESPEAAERFRRKSARQHAEFSEAIERQHEADWLRALPTPSELKH